MEFTEGPAQWPRLPGLGWAGFGQRLRDLAKPIQPVAGPGDKMLFSVGL